MESKRKLTNKSYADIENNKNILFCTDSFWVGQMHYGPPKEIFGWAMAHPKYRVAPPMKCTLDFGSKATYRPIQDGGSRHYEKIQTVITQSIFI
jgi:hypothetical protein